MRSFKFRILATSSLIVFGLLLAFTSESDSKEVEQYYKIPTIFQPHPGGGRRYRDWKVKNFGPVGIGITLKKPIFTMMINNVEKGSPADKTGKLKKGQIIESINGVVLKDRDPREILGDIITDAEAKDGKINLKIKGVGDVLVQIPVMGSYSKTWPVNCAKSDKIVRNLADFLAKQDTPRWGSVLFMLSTGEDKDLEVVKKWMKNIKPYGINWSIGYNGIGICEYYLRTGDKNVLPVIKEMADTLKKNMYNGGWSGRGQPANFTYSVGTGQVHASGVNCVTFLLMAKLCGVDVDEYTLKRSLKAFFRFAGRGNVAYGDWPPEGGFRDNGKTASLAVGMSAATLLDPRGEKSIYAQTRDNSGMKSFYATNWFHAAHTGGGMGEIWHNAAMSMLRDKRPTPYRSFLDTRRWVMELSRRFDGSIGVAGMDDRYDKSASEHERAWGTFFALTYTIPRKKLQIFGAPRSPYAKHYKLPDRPWGNAADDIFQSPYPVKGPYISMQDILNEKVETDASLPFLRRTSDPKVTDEVLLKYLYHPDYGIRSAAMRAAVNHERYNLVLPMLKSSDPRLRDNGLLAIIGMFKGKPMPAEKVTPEMYDLVGKMVDDPNESWWVARDAVTALARGGKSRIAKHRDRLLELLKVDSIWLQTQTVLALSKLISDPEHCKKVLPPVLKTVGAFWNDAASGACTRALAGELKSAPKDIKAYAVPLVKDLYNKIPKNYIARGGAEQPTASKVMKSRVASIMNNLPGGTEFVETQPKYTMAYKLSGNKKDMYTFSGKFTPNKKLLGTWLWAIWPTPKNKKDIVPAVSRWVKNWIKGGKKRVKAKDTLVLKNGGKLKSKFFKGYFWSGDMLINMNGDEARKMQVITVDGVDVLVIESGGFSNPDTPPGWQCGYSGYVRKK